MFVITGAPRSSLYSYVPRLLRAIVNNSPTDPCYIRLDTLNAYLVELSLAGHVSSCVMRSTRTKILVLIVCAAGDGYCCGVCPAVYIICPAVLLVIRSYSREGRHRFCVRDYDDNYSYIRTALGVHRIVSSCIHGIASYHIFRGRESTGRARIRRIYV